MLRPVSIRIVKEPILGYGITLPVYDDFALEYPPTTVVFQDTPQGELKTTRYPLSDQWRNYIQSINSPEAFRWMMNVGNMVINPPQEVGKTLCESMMSGANYFAYNAETFTHVRVLCYDHNSDPSQLDPEIDNHSMNPTRFWKASAADKYGHVINVGAGLDAYWPLMGHAPVWINKKFCILFPHGYDYHFKKSATEIYDGGSLLRGYRNGQVYLPNPNWQKNFTTFVPARGAL